MFLCIVAPQLASPFAGLLVDRVRRRTLLLAVNPLTALAVLPLLAVHDRGDVWIIYAVATAYGASYVVLSAGQSALLHTLVPTDQLAKANATLQTVREALRLVTPLAGAGLYTLAGGAAVALLDAATFLPPPPRCSRSSSASRRPRTARATPASPPARATSPARPTSRRWSSAARCACS